MHAAVLLAIYCLVTVVASLAGGWVPLAFRITHRRMQIAISFVSCVMLGIGLLHLVPHTFEALQSIDRTVAWVLAGFLFMFFLERFFHFHHHEIEDEGALSETAASARQHNHDDGAEHLALHDRAHVHATVTSPFTWGGAAVGLTLHGLVDGVAMAAAVKADDGVIAWAGLGTFLAIALHKPFDSLTIGTLLAAAGRGARFRHLLNALYSLVTPLGVVAFYALAAELGGAHDYLGQALGFAAGAFVCIATSDLLPELQFHRHDRAALSMALVAGILLAWSTVLLEGGHDHAHENVNGHAAEHDHE